MTVSDVINAETLPLEDEASDILNKARKGLGLSWEEIAERTGLNIPEVTSPTLPETFERLAFALNLHGPSLVSLSQGQWQPAKQPPLDGLAMFTTWYGDMTVNAYLVWDPSSKEASSFDTGSNCAPMLGYLQAYQFTLKRIFITHTHMDHLADLERLQAENPQALSYGSAIENPLGLKPLRGGDGLLLGNLKIRVLGTSGHTPGGLSYFIEGLKQPIIIVGDALFAGSMGGAPYAYQEALTNNQNKILSLPPETIICPGHGPLTTIGEERENNPFFPELKTH